MEGEVGVVIMSESLETLIENLKAFITDQVANYKLALTVNECRHEAMMYEVTCEKCDEDAIVLLTGSCYLTELKNLMKYILMAHVIAKLITIYHPGLEKATS